MAAVFAAFVLGWTRDHRLGADVVNRVIDPILLGSRLSGVGRSEIGTLEHVGRKTGTRRLTPVHPVPTEDGFRIVVPIGDRSQWAHNVLAAGRCRLQLHDVVHELDDPILLDPEFTPGLSRVARWLSSRLAFRYLSLHETSSWPGSLLDPRNTTPTTQLAEAELVAAAA
jgi:deazaflavin-dependent oxidoreductase (nitroreductase family)